MTDELARLEREIAGLDYPRAATNGMGHTAVTLAQRILRGEGE